MTVLILTGEEDVTADMVVVHLNGSGVPVVRVIERTYSERCDTLTWTTRARAAA